MVEQPRTSSSREQLDERWFARYRGIVSFDLFTWLAHAGPFTAEEQRAWNQLFEREDDEARKQRATIMARSRDRELGLALEEHREPRLSYPAIPIDMVRQRIKDLQQLSWEIAIAEQNHVVQRLYLDAIEEQLDVLLMVEATYHGDGDAFAFYNSSVYQVPSPQEMDFALTHLLRQLRRGLKRQETADISAHLLEYLQQRHLLSSPEELQDSSDESDQNVTRGGYQETPSFQEQVTFPAPTIKRFFEAVLREYQLDHWQILIDPAALVTRVEPQIQTILLPETPVPFDKALYLLSHELESHTLRYVAGERSALALLGIGTKGYLATEEGLALYADLMTARVQNPHAPENIPWMGTLATGMACGAHLSSGVAIPAHSFHSLFLFLEHYFLLTRVLNGTAQTIEAARANARALALTRCLRTFRGVPDLNRPGICSVKDNCYVQGYLAIKDAIAQQGEEVLTRLMVGAVALEQLDDLATLGIVTPALRSRWIARDPHLLEHITSLMQESDRQQAKNEEEIS
jgi:hypothetical protein